MITEEMPIVCHLTMDEAQALLARNHVGRIAFTLRDQVQLEPIHYAYDAPWIFGRTSADAQLLGVAHAQWCAFEADEAQGMFDWESVVVKGPFYQNSPLAAWDYARAVAALRHLLPRALRHSDPTPARDYVFGVHASEITGRRSVGNAAKEGRASDPAAGRHP